MIVPIIVIHKKINHQQPREESDDWQTRRSKMEEIWFWIAKEIAQIIITFSIMVIVISVLFLVLAWEKWNKK